MKTKLTENGPELSRVIAGVMNWGQWGANLNKQGTVKLMEQCVEIGVTSFDHADIYGSHTTEGEFGQAFIDSTLDREKIQLITKCGICFPSDVFPNFTIKSYNTTKEHIRTSVERSLRELRTEYIDVLLIHRPSPIMDPEVIADAFSKLKEEGKVLHFGLSNFLPHQVDLMQSCFSIVTNQIEASLLATDVFLDGTLDHTMQYKYAPMAWSPLGGGALFGKSNKHSLIQKREQLLDVAKSLEMDLDMLSYVFLLHHPSRIFPVTGSSRIERIRKAVDALDIEISNEKWFAIWQACIGNDIP